MARPTASGRSVTCSNFAIFAGLPSSSTVNADSVRSFTGRLSRVTVVGSSTRWTFTSAMNCGVLMMTVSSAGGDGSPASVAVARR